MISFSALFQRFLIVFIMFIGLLSCKSHDNIRYMKHLAEVALVYGKYDYPTKIVPDDV